MPAVAALLGVALAAQLSVVVEAPAGTAACEPVQVSVTVTAPGRQVPRIGLPSFAPFLLQRATVSPHFRMDASGGVETVVDARYQLVTDRVGTFTIPPFTVAHRGALVRSRPLRIRVRGSSVSAPPVVGQARVDTTAEVNFRALVTPDTVYVGQQATYQVAVFLTDRVRERLRRNPTFFPPDMQSMLAYDLPAWRGEPPRRKVGTQCFDVLVYERALFPLLPGRFVIPPAQLTYALALGPGFFSREESRELRTDTVVVVAIAPPEEGRPDDFMGAVGVLGAESRIDSAQARVGNPLVLTLRVSGEANVKLLPRPPITVPWATVLAGAERVEVDSAASRVRGSKEFDWIVTPLVAGELEVPPLRYSYFDPQRREYRTAQTQPARVRVAPGTLASSDTAAPPPLSIRLRDRRQGAPPWHREPWVVLLALAAPLPALLRHGRRRRHRGRTTLPSAERRLRQAARRGVSPVVLRRAYIDALAERLEVEAEPFTRSGALERALRLSGVSAPLAREAEAFMRRLDAAAYAAGGQLQREAGSTAISLLDRVSAEALPRTELRERERPGIANRLLPILMLAALAPGALQAQGPDDISQFRFGVQAYQAGRFEEALVSFSWQVSYEPRSADAWANLGTAAWAVGDTARAVHAWQRALRLEPLARDVRTRLDLAGAGARGSYAFVPPVPPGVIPAAALILWLVGWGLVALPRRVGARRLAVPVLVVAVLLAIVAVEVDRRGSLGTLAVVASQTAMRSVPGSPAPGPVLRVGEVVRTGVREGPWTHVRADGGGEGWVEAARLHALDQLPR